MADSAAPVDYWPCGCVKGETPHGAGWADCEYVKQGQTPADPELFARAQGRLGRSAAFGPSGSEHARASVRIDGDSAGASAAYEPQPTEGPDYHAEHAFWRERQQSKVKCPRCPFVNGCPGQCGWKVERNG